jgi:acetyltransferase-like isoleucine patch superfamily enzyme
MAARDSGSPSAHSTGGQQEVACAVRRWQSGAARPLLRVIARLEAKERWTEFWLRRAGLGPGGRVAARLAALFAAPYKGGERLARLTPRGYVAPGAVINHPRLRMGAHVFIADGVVIYQADEHGGSVELGDDVHLQRDIIIEVGAGGSLVIGAHTHVQPRCQFSAYLGSIRIGVGVQIAPYCAFYPYDHGFAPGMLISHQPLRTRGDIVIEDDAWLGVGVIVLDGVRIGKGAVIGAGAVVTQDIPDEAIATGVPARVVRTRSELGSGEAPAPWMALH